MTSDIRSAQQIWVDSYLEKLDPRKVELLVRRNADLTVEERAERRQMYEDVDLQHKKDMNNLPRKMRFISPSKVMMLKRAADIVDGGKKGPTVSDTPVAEG